MTEQRINDVLRAVASGRLSVERATCELKLLPFEDLGFAKVDLHRELRRGVPEVVLGEYKSAAQIVEIGKRVVASGQSLVVTRLAPDKATAVRRRLKSLLYHEEARLGMLLRRKVQITGHGTIAVICAGTSDIAVAEEAALCAEALGNRVARLYDVGVAGLHRLAAHREIVTSAAVLIVVAGMEGALPSVVAGLVDRPVVAVPTSIGYGVAFGGLAALMGMLNSCAGGVTVVNIDNGYGAAIAATLINRVGMERADGRA